MCNVVKIQRFSTHDGPGLRTVVFLKGCPLNCAWCHNPETKSPKPQIFYHAKNCIGCGLCAALCPAGAHEIDRDGCHIYHSDKCLGCRKCAAECPTGALEAVGREMSMEEILDICERDRAFYGEKGGITVSGGEPMFWPEETLALLRAAKERGLTTAVETCGFFAPKYVSELVKYADLLLWDVKDTDEARHLRYTGVGTAKIMDNLRLADRLGGRTLLRCILVNGVNATTEHAEKVAQLCRELEHCQGVEWLPYHAYGGSKNAQLGGEDNGREDWIPTKEQIDRMRKLTERCGCKCV